MNYTTTGPMLDRATTSSAGLDLRATEDTAIMRGTITKISTGVNVEIPDGHVGLLAVRSGLASKGVILANGVGIIDADYRGEVGVMLTRLTPGHTHVKAGDRVAQLVIVPAWLGAPVCVAELSGTERGTGGFGSSGR